MNDDAQTWEREEHVDCVSCPVCAFTFDACHEDQDGGYSCPCCAEARLVALVGTLTAVLRGAQFFITSSMPLIEEGDISGEGVEIGGEVLAKIDGAINLARAAPEAASQETTP